MWCVALNHLVCERAIQSEHRHEETCIHANNSQLECRNTSVFCGWQMRRGWDQELCFSSLSFSFVQLLSAAYLSILAIIQPNSWFCLGVHRVLILTAAITARRAHTGVSASILGGKKNEWTDIGGHLEKWCLIFQLLIILTRRVIRSHNLIKFHLPWWM